MCASGVGGLDKSCFRTQTVVSYRTFCSVTVDWKTECTFIRLTMWNGMAKITRSHVRFYYHIVNELIDKM